MFLLILSVLFLQYAVSAPAKEASQGPSPFCAPCRMMLKTVQQYPEPMETLLALPCRMYGAGESCLTATQSFLKSVKDEEDVDACKQYKFCGEADDIVAARTLQSQQFQIPGFPIQFPSFQLPTINGFQLPKLLELPGLPLPRIPGLPIFNLGGNTNQEKDESEQDEDESDTKPKTTKSERRPKQAQSALFTNPFDQLLKGFFG